MGRHLVMKMKWEDIWQWKSNWNIHVFSNENEMGRHMTMKIKLEHTCIWHWKWNGNTSGWWKIRRSTVYYKNIKKLTILQCLQNLKYIFKKKNKKTIVITLKTRNKHTTISKS
jgi:hypothetical protein